MVQRRTDPAAGRDALTTALLRRQVGDDHAERVAQFADTKSSPRRGRRRRGSAHAGTSARRFGAHHGAEAAADPVAGDGAADAAADGVGDARRSVACPTASAGHVEDSSAAARPAGECAERRTVTNAARSGRQACRGPWRRRRRITARPAARPHPEAEAVLLLPLPVVRLERPLHAWPPRTPGPREWALGAARHRCAGTWRLVAVVAVRAQARRAGGQCSVRVVAEARQSGLPAPLTLGNTPLGRRFPTLRRCGPCPDGPCGPRGGAGNVRDPNVPAGPGRRELPRSAPHGAHGRGVEGPHGRPLLHTCGQACGQHGGAQRGHSSGG